MNSGLEAWLEILACPACGGALRCRVERALVCSTCEQSFTVERGILSLVPEARKADLAALSVRYRQARLEEGWRPMTARQLQALPYGTPEGYPPLYWSVRRQTFWAFMHLIEQEGPPPDQCAADLGAGTGWLAQRLAERGYRTVALDASLDEDLGLGAAIHCWPSLPERFLPVRGDLDALPLRRSSFGLIVFNASLHYARDLDGTLRRATWALRPGGRLVVLDTPIARNPRLGSDLGDRHLGRRELDRALRACGLRSRRVSVWRGLRWQLYRLRAALRGDRLFSFPMVVGSAPDQGP